MFQDGGAVGGARFGTRVAVHGDLAVVAAHGEMAIYVLARGDGGGGWAQRLRLGLDFELMSLWLDGDAMLLWPVPWLVAELHVWKYDRDRNEVVALQDPFVIDPGEVKFEIAPYECKECVVI